MNCASQRAKLNELPDADRKLAVVSDTTTDDGETVLNSIVKMDFSGMGCTGIAIADDVVITASHCPVNSGPKVPQC